MNGVMDLDTLLPAVRAAEVFQTSIPVILMWRNRGWVDPDGCQQQLRIAARDKSGRPLYRWRDLLAAERGTRKSRERAGGRQRARLDSPYSHRAA